MADVLSPEDRALIDAALAAGRVTVVPQGVSGLPVYVCDPATGKLVTGLGHEGWRAARRAEGVRKVARAARLQAVATKPVVEEAPKVRKPGCGRKPDPQVRARHDRLRVLIEGGAPRAQIDALYVGMNRNALHRDCSILGLRLPDALRITGRKVMQHAPA
jgi:hypothetical protein